MSNFSDKEDRALVQFGLKQEGTRKGHMSWEQIAKQMRTKKSPEQLRCRMNSLKARHGTRIADFPRWYFVKAPRHKIRQGETSRHSKREEEQQARDLDRKAVQDLRHSLVTMKMTMTLSARPLCLFRQVLAPQR